MNEFETYMMADGINKNLQKKMDRTQKPKKQKREDHPKFDLQAYIQKGFKMVQAFRNWIVTNLKRKQESLLQ